MWIYQEPSNPRCLPAASVPELYPAVPVQMDIPEKPQEKTDTTVSTELESFTIQEPPKNSLRKSASASRDCILLAGAYLFGAFLSGVLQAVCDSTEKDMLSYYLSCWQSIFTVSSAAGLPKLFGAELWTVFGALLVLFFLGLSAIGPIFIFLFVMLYGLGSGLLFSQWMVGINLQSFLLVLIAAGLPAALAAGGLCLFGASALQVSSRIQAFSFGRREGIPHKAGAKLLIGQFAVTATAFLPLCGLATGLAYLAGQIVS